MIFDISKGNSFTRFVKTSGYYGFTCDGKPVERVIYASEEEGIVRYYGFDDSTNFILVDPKTKEPVIYYARGKVKIFCNLSYRERIFKYVRACVHILRIWRLKWIGWRMLRR